MADDEDEDEGYQGALFEEIARFLDHESVTLGDELRGIASAFREMRDEARRLRARVAELEGEIADAAGPPPPGQADARRMDGPTEPGE